MLWPLLLWPLLWPRAALHGDPFAGEFRAELAEEFAEFATCASLAHPMAIWPRTKRATSSANQYAPCAYGSVTIEGAALIMIAILNISLSQVKNLLLSAASFVRLHRVERVAHRPSRDECDVDRVVQVVARHVPRHLEG